MDLVFDIIDQVNLGVPRSQRHYEQMFFKSQNSWQSWITFASAIGLSFTLINSPLAVAERVNPVLLASQPQRAILTGRNGQYVVRIVVNSSADTAWKVLTDYNNFYQFLPNVTSSKLLKVQGNQKVFEQVYRIKALIVDETSRIRLSASETYPKQIAFKLVEGEVKALQGSWTIEPISSKQVIIQHQVNVDPGSTRTRALFYSIYENTLKMTLEAIKKESERRN